ncbi:LuxR C-terminal-related transcriptional regulator [Kitasatospora sp. NBC_01560]|uniref:TrmB family transcriptional regulator n=1 Tax=Kitasatospora sp. NBC_01560 TaxID=2975965 RepID=UPI00386BD6A0
MLGLDERTETVYRMMLTHHRWGIKELAHQLGMTEDELRAALDRLTDLRLLIESAPRGEVAPVSPEVGLQSLLRRRQEELQHRQEEVERCRIAITSVLDEYADLYANSQRRHAEQLIGIDAIQARIGDLAAQATFECVTFNPGGAQSAASLAASKPLDESVIGRGVMMRTVYLDSVRNDSLTAEYADWLTGLGGEVRTVPALPVRMLLIDRRVALVPVDPANTRKGAVQLTGAGVVAGLVALFEVVWRDATPMGACTERNEKGLTGQELELLRLLAEGSTDAGAATRLGLSLRTVRRMMADLMERLDARGRFAAGLQAGKRGWL